MFYALFVRGHYFVHKDLSESALSTYSFKNLVFHLCIFCVFCLFYFELNFIFMFLTLVFLL